MVTEHKLYPACKCCDWGQIFRTVSFPMYSLHIREPRIKDELHSQLASLCHILRREPELGQTGALQLLPLCAFPATVGQSLPSPCVPHHASGDLLMFQLGSRVLSLRTLGLSTWSEGNSAGNSHAFRSTQSVALRCHWARNTAKF